MNTDIISSRIAANLGALNIAVGEFTGALPLSASWVQRDWQLHGSNAAHILLDGTKIALLEAATAWAIGANRAAAASLRAAIENAIAWLYYKDHLIEFRTVQARKGDLLLPKAVQSYIKTVDSGFESAYGNAEQVQSQAKRIHVRGRFAVCPRSPELRWGR